VLLWLVSLQVLRSCGSTTQLEIIMTRSRLNVLATCFARWPPPPRWLPVTVREEPTAGQKLDGALAQIESKANEVAADARAVGRDAQQAAGTAIDAVTTRQGCDHHHTVNAELAKDSQLSAYR